MNAFFAFEPVLRLLHSALFDGPSTFLSWRARREARVRDASPIASLHPGSFSKVVGRVRAREKLLLAPFTGRPCVAYAVVSEELASPRERKWRVEADIENVPDFELEDVTGTVIVRPLGWVLLDVVRTLITVREGYQAIDHIDAFITAYGHERSAFYRGFHATIRYRESVLEPNQLVAVVGEVADAAEGDAARSGYREVPRRVCVQSTDRRRLLVSSDPRATSST